jgi:hypothetical protein
LFVAVIAGVSVAAVMLAVVVASWSRARSCSPPRRRGQVARRDRLARADRAVSKLPVPLQRHDVAADDAGQRAAIAAVDVPS